MNQAISKVKLSGIYIAPVTPLKDDGKIDFDRLGKHIEFLIDAGIDGICVGGGTSEYPRFDLSERKELLRQSIRLVANRVKVLPAVGMPSFDRVLDLAGTATDEGAELLLLPPPHFFLYSQDDLYHFYREISRSLPVPCVLYNLPIFTNPIDPGTTVKLLRGEPRIVGIKDSGGDRKVLSLLKPLKKERPISLMMGNDELLLDALKSGWDGAISGLGNLCPEVLVLLARSMQSGDTVTAERCQQAIDQIIQHGVLSLPVPWAIRAGLEARGLQCGLLSLPPSPQRQTALKEFRGWFEKWMDETLPTLVQKDSAATVRTAGQGRS